ncbi:hypothetical protein ACLQ29_34440 [Micromonospora sp. DT228]|uniref:hypothetical protein n=1 Tax=Micromonospora sp. DT228 TaxID=3393443 RepID=UPI003CF39658
MDKKMTEWEVIDALDAVSPVDAEQARIAANMIMLEYKPQPVTPPVQWAYDSLKERAGWR